MVGANQAYGHKTDRKDIVDKPWQQEFLAYSWKHIYMSNLYDHIKMSQQALDNLLMQLYLCCL